MLISVVGIDQLLNPSDPGPRFFLTVALCVRVVYPLVQSGVSGFLTDMQKACSNYRSYQQKINVQRSS